MENIIDKNGEETFQLTENEFVEILSGYKEYNIFCKDGFFNSGNIWLANVNLVKSLDIIESIVANWIKETNISENCIEYEANNIKIKLCDETYFIVFRMILSLSKLLREAEKNKFNPEIKEVVQKETNQKTYLMFDENTKLVKIGRTNNPKLRETTFKNSNPFIKCIYICNNDVEIMLHRKFKNKKIKGEWFKLSDDEIANIVIDYKFTEHCH